MSLEEMKEMAKTVRRDIVKMTCAAGSGHPGGSLSSTDILVALYFGKMNHNPLKPDWEERDRFVLSKGHVCPALYAVLSRAGYFAPDELMTLRQMFSRLQGHPAKNKKLPGIEVSSGSLGQGLSVAVGIALGAKIDKKPFKTYCLCGDGELQEGQIWEAVMTAAHYKLDNLVCMVDKNNLQIDGKVHDVMNIDPLKEKFDSFNWHTIECDGHDFDSLNKAYDEAISTKGKPVVIIAETIKGKGVSFMEDQAGWHGKAPNKEQCELALQELS
ncbi:MAG: transketolase [Cyanobacteriota bacterium]